MAQNPGTLDATGDISTESKQDDIIAELEKLTQNSQPFGGFFLSNETFGILMNVDVGFTGTPEVVNNGGDSTGWTPTNLTGSNFDFTSTTHAMQGIVTVVDFSLLSGDTVTVNGTNITNTTLTEGVDWTAATSNAATATSLTTAIAAISGIDSTLTTATANVINVVTDVVLDADLTTLTTSDGTNLPASAQSIDATSTVDGDQALFTAPSSISMSDFTTLAGSIYITTWNSSFLHEITIQPRLSGVNVGTAIEVSQFVNKGIVNEWQNFNILRTSFDLTDETVDELVITTVDSGPGTPPNYFIDNFRWEESGGGIEFSFEPDAGTVLLAETLTVFASSPGIPDLSNVPPELVDQVQDDAFWTLGELPNGLATTFIIAGEAGVGALVKSNQDIIGLPDATFSIIGYDNKNNATIFQWKQEINANLQAATGDKYSLTVNDDLSSMRRFTVFIKGRIETV